MYFPTENPWKTLSSMTVFDNPWIEVTEHEVINPAGLEGLYGKVHFKNKALGIIPLDQALNTWLVGQFRYTLGEFSWEIPMGGGPLDEDPQTSAQRELQEETGISASRWTEVMRLHTSNSVTDEEGFVFLAEDLNFGKANLEATESDLKVWKLPLAEAVDLVMQGKITDAITVAGLLKVARMKGI
jgi:8-oxo-dGTP pyrophosphatase MutT (NUDIX family)